MAATKQTSGGNSSQQFGRGLARAAGGSIIFALPLLMTMEMWWLGFYMGRMRLAILMIVFLPMLVGLAYHVGFERDRTWKDAVLDALSGYAVGWIVSAAVLTLFAILKASMPLEEVVGKISLQAVPASFGALIARSQFGSGGQEQGRGGNPRYASEMFLMAVGAIYLAFNVAPTEEMVLIPYKMTQWHAAALAVVSLLLLHGFVYAMEIQGGGSVPKGTPWWSVFLRFSITGYALALLISWYVLWTFGRTEGMAWAELSQAVVVLGFPAAIGAAAGRIVL